MFNKTASSSVFKSHTIPGNPWQRHPLPMKVSNGLTYKIMENEYDLAIGWSLAPIGSTRTQWPVTRSGVVQLEARPTANFDDFDEGEIYDGTASAWAVTQGGTCVGLKHCFDRGSNGSTGNARDQVGANYPPLIIRDASNLERALDYKMARFRRRSNSGEGNQLVANDNSDYFAIDGVVRTIALVVRFGYDHNDYMDIMTKYASATGGYLVSIFPNNHASYPGGMRFYFTQSGGGTHADYVYEYDWHNDSDTHVLFIEYDGTDNTDMGVRLWVDNDEKAITTITSSTGTYGDATTGNLVLGRREGGAPFYPADFEWGSLLLFNRALTGEERTNVHNFLSTKHGLADAATPYSSWFTSLLDYWRLDKTSGNRPSDWWGDNWADTGTVGSTTGKNGNATSHDSSVPEYFQGADTLFGFQEVVPTTAGPDAVSVSLWFKTADSGANQCMFALSHQNENPALRVYVLTSGEILVQAESRQSDATQSYTTSGLTADDDAWHHLKVCADYANDQIIVQFDGGAETSGSVSFASTYLRIESAGAQDGIGATHAGSSGWDGELDEIAIWGRVITEAEGTSLYNSGSGLFLENW